LKLIENSENDNENDSILELKNENEKLKMQIQGKDEMIELLKKQLENQNEIISQLSKQQAPIIDASHNTVNNNTFNLNFYLNETCKNAISFEKFIQDFNVNRHLFDNFIVPDRINGDSHKTKTFGDIFHKNMTKYSQVERPIQTTDKVRNHFYYKTNDKWVHSKDDITTFHKFLNEIEMKKIMIPAREYENENMIKGNDTLEEKFDKIKVGLFSELKKDTFINSFIPKYNVNK
jgi:hypothetical protein